MNKKPLFLSPALSIKRRTIKRRTIKRRNVLGFIGGAAAVSLLGCQRQSAGSTAAESSELSTKKVANTGISAQSAADMPQTALPSCIVSPEQTEGPYFVEESLNRSDIREGKAGVPLRLVLRVSQVSASECVPLSGAIVDLWHCDAEGVYSDVTDRSFDTVGEKFLRGSQVSGADGTVEFITIYPGWYRGRTVHTHFKIRNSTNLQGYEFTSQLYFDDALSDEVFAQSPYNSRGQRDMRNARDRIYQDGGQQLTLQLTEANQGYTGTFDIGLAISG